MFDAWFTYAPFVEQYLASILQIYKQNKRLLPYELVDQER